MEKLVTAMMKHVLSRSECMYWSASGDLMIQVRTYGFTTTHCNASSTPETKYQVSPFTLQLVQRFIATAKSMISQSCHVRLEPPSERKCSTAKPARLWHKSIDGFECNLCSGTTCYEFGSKQTDRDDLRSFGLK